MESGISFVKRNFLFKFVMFVLILMGLSCFQTSALKVGDTISDKDCLTFTAIDGNATVKFSWSEANKVMCSVDNGDNWFNYDKNKEIYLEKGESVKFKGSGVSTVSDDGKGCDHGFGSSLGHLSASGNLNSLRLDDNLEKFVGLQDDCFWGIFYDFSGLIDASKLILDAEILSPNCYGKMFHYCTGLINAPELPATTLAEYCYYWMFDKCTSLTKAPELPATTLASNCYDGMFGGCASLESAPELPATNLAEYCYYRMFDECTSLIKAPALLATSLEEDCYREMFNGCNRLTKAPDLPATNLAYRCYTCMFYGCTSLIEAPDLPATQLADYCYSDMFDKCTSLTKAPILPSTSLAEGCYFGMFAECESLVNAPELPATTLEKSCYSNMFSKCTSLTKVPDLPATHLAEDCYFNMFSECTNLEFSELMTDKYNKEWTIRTDSLRVDDHGHIYLGSRYESMFCGCIVNWLENTPENSTVTLYQKEKDNLTVSNGLTGSYNNNNKSELLSTTSEKQETSSLKEPSDDIDPKYDSDTKSVSSNQLANSQDYESKSSKSLAASKNSDSVSSSSLTSNQSSYSGSSNAAKSSAIKTGELSLNSTLLEFFLLMLLSFKRKRFGC